MNKTFQEWMDFINVTEAIPADIAERAIKHMLVSGAIVSSAVRYCTIRGLMSFPDAEYQYDGFRWWFTLSEFLDLLTGQRMHLDSFDPAFYVDKMRKLNY